MAEIIVVKFSVGTTSYTLIGVVMDTRLIYKFWNPNYTF